MAKKWGKERENGQHKKIGGVQLLRFFYLQVDGPIISGMTLGIMGILPQEENGTRRLHFVLNTFYCFLQKGRLKVFYKTSEVWLMFVSS